MLFNERVNTQKLGLVRKFTDEANKLDHESKIFLSIGVPDLPMVNALSEGINEAINKGFTKYTATQGIDFVRQSVADTYINRKCTYPITKDNIIITAGSQEAIFLLMLSIIGAGDEVIVINPSFFSFKRCSLMMGGGVIEVGYKYNGESYSIPFEELENKITDRCKMIYINSPNNPTGIVTCKEEMIQLTDLARKYDITILSDEVYKDYVYGEIFHSPIEYYDKVIIVDSISKTFSATGLRIGWMVAHKEIIDKIIPMHQQVVFSTMSIGQYALYHALNHPTVNNEIQERISIFKERHNYVVERLDKIAQIKIIPARGAFYIWCELDPVIGMNGVDFCYGLLYEKGVVTTPGIDFGNGLENFFRIAYTQDISKLKDGIDRLEEFIKTKRMHNN